MPKRSETPAEAELLYVQAMVQQLFEGTKKVDARLPGKRNSKSHGAKPVHIMITMMKWIRTSRLSIKNSLSVKGPGWPSRVDP